MIRKYLSLDIETARSFPRGESWRDHMPLGIACVGLATGDGGVVWYGRTPEGDVADFMSPTELQGLVYYLECMERQGYTIVTWNGLGFDLPMIAEESGLIEQCSDLARRHVDMMYHVLCDRGWLLGLNNAAKGMGVGEKTEGISGAEAPIYWQQGERDLVMRYCQDDANLTLALAEACEREGRVSWTSKRGNPQAIYLPYGWDTVQVATMRPEPDVRSLNNPILRGDINGWLR